MTMTDQKLSDDQLRKLCETILVTGGQKTVRQVDSMHLKLASALLSRLDAKPAAVPDGYKLVSAEPDNQWAESFCRAVNWHPDGTENKFIEGQLHSVTFRDLAKGYIRAVLAAAPEAQPAPTYTAAELCRWWAARCPSCGWRGLSRDCDGGNSIADTGDFSEVLCPKCGEAVGGDHDAETAKETAPAPKDDKPLVNLGQKLFSFRTFDCWVNGAQRLWKLHKVNSKDTVCIDQHGRICGWGEHFMAARDDGAFPVDVYLMRPNMDNRHE